MSRLVKYAMVNRDGAVFMPPTVEDARRIYAKHGARPAGPEFPWPCTAVRSMWIGTTWATTQCVLVDGHDGEHIGEVSW
jgi:hypothetical protein